MTNATTALEGQWILQSSVASDTEEPNTNTQLELESGNESGNEAPEAQAGFEESSFTALPVEQTQQEEETSR